MELKSYKELKDMLKNNTGGFSIIIFGVEKKLIKDSINLIYGTVQILPELNVVTLEGERISYDEVVNACETLPIMGDKRIVHIKNPQFLKKSTTNDSDEVKKQPTAQGDTLVDYLTGYVKSIPNEAILIISYDDEVDFKNKMLHAIKSKGYSLEFKKLRGEELSNSITAIFEKNEKKISKSDLLYFIATIGNSSEVMEQEIEKVCMYASGEDFVTKKHIDEIVTKGIENNIFKMVDSISIKNADAAISILDVLLFQKEEPLRILGMIIRQYRILYLIYLMLEQRKSIEEIKSNLKSKKINLMDFVVNNYIKQARNYNAASLREALGLCLEADCNIKTSRFAPELVMETLIVQLCK